MPKPTEINGINRREFLTKTSIALAGIAALKSNAFAIAAKNTGLKDLYKKDFSIGTAIGAGTFRRNDEEMFGIIKREFNSITAENEFKWSVINPSENEWKFDFPDQFVKFGLENHMYMLGHCLVWHSQVPRGLFTDESGKQISKEALLKKMETHITTLVDKYKGKMNAWDVVNEALTPEEGWRKSNWIKIIGPEFMEKAFQYAHEADPKAHLIYNDYNEEDPKRRQLIVDVIKDYKKRGIPIMGIGMQGHLNLETPDLKEWEASLVAFGQAGMKVHVTELDIDVLPYNWNRTADVSTNVDYAKTLNPYVDGLPKDINDKLTKRYEDIFKILLKHRNFVERVTFWGVSDDQSWKNNFPVRGRTNYPLLFDRQHKPKDCYYAIAALKK